MRLVASLAMNFVQSYEVIYFYCLWSAGVIPGCHREIICSSVV